MVLSQQAIKGTGMLFIDSSFNAIDQLNREAIDRIALQPDFEKSLGISHEDLALFFNSIPGTRMLDVGCGAGRYVQHFTERNMDYVGVDYSPNMIQVARSRNPGQQFLEMDYHKLGFDDASFDGIWAFCVFGNEPKVRLPSALAEMRRVLKPGGVLLIVNVDWDTSMEEVGEVGPNYGPMYLSLWHFEDFDKLLSVNGFTIRNALRRPRREVMTFLCVK
jgi:ubiquinone/menaquinone biosynthesis C-methylase UbiE